MKLYNRVWDLTKNDDFAPEMENSFFVPTNIFITPNQQRGACPEFIRTNQTCTSDADCSSSDKMWAVNDHGVRTGKCVDIKENTASSRSGSSRWPSSRSSVRARKSCEVRGWCPLETGKSLASSTKAILEDTKHFHLQIRNHVQFSMFGLDWGIRRDFNVQDVVEEAIKSFNKCKKCQLYSGKVSEFWDEVLGDADDSTTTKKPARRTKRSLKRTTKQAMPKRTVKTTPIPRKGSTAKIPVSDVTYHDIAMKGAVINVGIHWSCHMGILRGSSQSYFRKHCLPKITFILMPSHRPDGFKDPERKGRFVHKPDHNGHGASSKRDLYKTYGIWFRFYVTSDVSRFSFMNTFKVLFIGLGLVKLNDVIFKWLAPKLCCKTKLHSEEYRKARYMDIEDDDFENEMIVI